MASKIKQKKNKWKLENSERIVDLKNKICSIPSPHLYLMTTSQIWINIIYAHKTKVELRLFVNYSLAARFMIINRFYDFNETQTMKITVLYPVNLRVFFHHRIYFIIIIDNRHSIFNFALRSFSSTRGEYECEHEHGPAIVLIITTYQF